MTQTLWQLIAQYGYFAVMAGCFFEGEAAILLGVLAAHNGMLSEHYVWLSAVVGTVLGDNIWFHVGHKMGRPALARRPKWWAKAARIENLVHHYGAFVMIGFRYLYALRSVTPFVLGTLGVSPKRFLFYDIIGTLIWSTLMTFIATKLAGFIMLALSNIHIAEKGILATVLVGALAAGVVVWLRRRHHHKQR